MQKSRSNNFMRTAFVTGSSSGIGKAIALRLLTDGWRVDGFDIAAPVITHDHFRSHAIDLTDAEATTASIRAALNHGTPEALVHAAGVLRIAPLGALQHGDGALMWQVNVAAAASMANLVLPAMCAARHGRVVLIGSRVAKGVARRSQYAATKAALVALARSWAIETVASGVTVNVIAPAATDTGMLTDPARSSTAPRTPPIGRFIQPAEIAALTVFLLSPDAAAITGQEIAICGGASLS
jgi:3-oxoacyl-[acyl-carrier protein] reductase